MKNNWQKISKYCVVICMLSAMSLTAFTSKAFALELEPTIESTSAGGKWSQSSTWKENRVPDPDDVVGINGRVYLDGGTKEVRGLVVEPDAILRGDSRYRWGGIRVSEYVYNQGAIGGYLHTIQAGGYIDNQGIINPYRTMGLLPGHIIIPSPLQAPAHLEGDVTLDESTTFSILETREHNIEVVASSTNITLEHSRDTLHVMGTSSIVFSASGNQPTSFDAIDAASSSIQIISDTADSRGDIIASVFEIDSTLVLDTPGLYYNTDIDIFPDGQVHGESVWVSHAWEVNGDIHNQGIIGPHVSLRSNGDIINSGSYTGQEIHLYGNRDKRLVGDFSVKVELKSPQRLISSPYIHTLETNGHPLRLPTWSTLYISNLSSSDNTFLGKGDLVIVNPEGNETYSPNVQALRAPNLGVIFEASAARIDGNVHAKTIELYDDVFVSDDIGIVTDEILFSDATLRGRGSSREYRVSLEAEKIVGSGQFGPFADMYFTTDIPRGFTAAWNTDIYIEDPNVSWADTYKLFGSVYNMLKSGSVLELGRPPNLRDVLNSGETHYFSYLSDRGWTQAFSINAQENKLRAQSDIAKQNFFKISFIPNQQIHQAFDITITTPRDPDFAGSVKIIPSRGAISPSRVELKDGIYQGGFTLYREGSSQELQVEGTHRYLGYSGRSNRFDVTGEEDMRGKIQGVVRSKEGERVDHGNIALFGHTTQESHEVSIQTNGTYQAELGCGSYELSTTGVAPRLVDIPCNETVVYDLVQSRSCASSDKTPVLLVPGIQGSDSSEQKTVIFPELTAHIPRWDEGALHLHDPFGSVGWGRLIEALEEAGYEEGCTIFTVPYDWSLSVTDSAEQFLSPVVAHAQAVASSTQVDIVAHSMGGLVARSYIQGSDYREDVRRLALVGTPNAGSALAYFSWEGGDTYQADKYGGNLLEDLLEKLVQADQFQTKTTAKNYEIKTGNDDSLCWGWGPPFEYSVCDRVRTKEFLHDHAPSVGELYPTYQFLFDSDNEEAITPKFENKLLRALNNKECRGGECGYDFVPPEERGVETRHFIGMEENTFGPREHTPRSIYVSPESDVGYDYTDGVVVAVEQGLGDGTVLVDSVQEVVAESEFIDAAHSELIVEQQSDIINFLKN